MAGWSAGRPAHFNCSRMVLCSFWVSAAGSTPRICYLLLSGVAAGRFSAGRIIEILTSEVQPNPTSVDVVLIRKWPRLRHQSLRKHGLLASAGHAARDPRHGASFHIGCLPGMLCAALYLNWGLPAPRHIVIAGIILVSSLVA